MASFEEPDFVQQVADYDPDPLVTRIGDLSPENQKFFEQLAAGVGLSSGQAYLDWRGGFYNTTTYFGDTPSWRKLPVGVAATAANYIKYTTDAWTKDPSQIPDMELRQAVIDGTMTAAQAAQYYWGPDGSNRYSADSSFSSGSGAWGGSAATSASMTAGAGSGLTPAQENAVAILTKTFELYGLSTLAPAILNLVKAGYAADTVSLLLQDTPEYKQRFAANEARRKAGMAVLSPAEYLATERAYRQIMNAAGLPSGFYDQQEDFTALLSKDISPAELNARVQTAADAVLNADPFYTQSLRDLYGMTNGDMIAFVLNPDRSLPIIQQKANAVAFGAAAQRQGIDNIGVDTAEQYAGLGVGKAQAEQGFASIATMLPRTEQLGQIYGSDYNQSAALSEVFNNDVQAAQKRRKLVQSETDTFTGQSGVRAGSLATSSQGLI